MKRNPAAQSPETLACIARLGLSIKRARTRRRLTQGQLAERAGIARRTVARLEQGDPGIALGSALEVLAVLEAGWPEALVDVVETDEPGRVLEDARLPSRVVSGEGF